MTACYFSACVSLLFTVARACHLVGAMSVPGAMLTGHFCGRDTKKNT